MLYNCELLDGTRYETSTKRDIERVAKANLQATYYKNFEPVDVEYNVKFYTIYRVHKDIDDIRPLIQFDDIYEVLRFIGEPVTRLASLLSRISQENIINDKYIIKCDIIDVGELWGE